ncbi:MAG: hypothetical protein RLN85_02825, partial [Pseudomonadales bacterium]
MKFEAEGQKSSSVSMLVDSRFMLRSMVFGMSFAIGLTFATGQGIAQTDTSNPQPVADDAMTGGGSAETKTDEMAPADTPTTAPSA